ncbi:MAG: nitroreductase family protein [Candidatus Omnitrophica bacterium]|nr:nitroreductase family protein [Candidatus Omnitrophota bacterium]
MDIFSLIKDRKTIRKYKDKPIPKEIIDKIVEAGIWGPSVPSFLKIQPWKFVVVTEKKRIKQITELLKKSKKTGIAINIMLSSAANIIDKAPFIIVVYNSKDLEKLKEKFKLIYSKFARIIKAAQLSAISAAIQNMILVAEDLGISSCWLDTPLFCKNEINKIFNTNNELIAILTFGYSAEKGKRSPRKPISDTVDYI